MAVPTTPIGRRPRTATVDMPADDALTPTSAAHLTEPSVRSRTHLRRPSYTECTDRYVSPDIANLSDDPGRRTS